MDKSVVAAAGVVVVLFGLVGGLILSSPSTEASAGKATQVAQGPLLVGEVISQGEEVEIANYLRDDAWTVVEFTAEW